jgi:hypothetical protein
MAPKLTRADYVCGYTIRVQFADGVEGELELFNELWGEVFEPLKNPDLFRAFQLNEELNTIAWPTGADLAPEFLYEEASRRFG